MPKEKKYSVEVVEAVKSYKDKLVLNNFSMKVEEGSIYGLLGPSGCGKTTLLGALVDRVQLDSGSIRMNTKSRSEIGYMPQEVTLYPELSLKEHLIYYGRIYSMTKTMILSRSEELREFLQLPQLNCIINQMSGGQQRRVSLCITLLHNPQLLILDEPTVGVDIILAQTIWENLIHMSQNEGKTIILTTHYIEEARRSNTIGLMRNGVLLAEDSPEILMELHNCDSLEQVFLTFCEDSEQMLINQEQSETDYKFKPSPHLDKTTTFNLNRVLAHVMKNVYWMRRNIPSMLFTFFLPVIQCILMSLTVGEHPSGLSLAAVSYELPEGVRCQDYHWRHPLTCDINEIPFSCYIIKKIMDKNIMVEQYSSLEKAKYHVQKNYHWGVLYFNKDYTISLKNRFRIDAKNDTIMDNSQIDIWMDSTDSVINSYLKGCIVKSLYDFISELSDTCSWHYKGGALPVGYDEPIYGSYSLTFRQSMTPANAVLFMFYFPILFTVGALITEKSSGLLSRGLVAGLSFLDIGIGHTVLQYIILSVQTLFVWMVFFCLFDNVMIGDKRLCFFILLLVGTCGMFHGFTIVSICESFTTASCVAFGRYFPIFLLTGAIWPVEGMHHILQTVAINSPLTRAVEAFRGVSMRGWTLSHPVIYSGVVTVVMWIAIYGMITVIALRYKGIRV